jgi:UTP--glucose-1-phosphate uridylyltransferase
MYTPSLSSSYHIDRAIVPAAGYGTRMRPLTHAIPKEMLPLGRKPALEYVLEELRDAKIQRALLVISPRKQMIRDYFGDGSAWGVRCEYVVQPQMLGLGDAVLRGESWVQERPFVVAFGDCVIEAKGEPPLARLLRAHTAQRADATVLTERIAPDQTRKYGIVAPAGQAEEFFPLSDIVEKPEPEQAPSNLAVAARWALSPRIFPYLRRVRPDVGGERNLTDAVRGWMAEGGRVWAVAMGEGESRCDIGGWETYLKAAARAAARDPEFGAAVREALREEAMRL